MPRARGIQRAARVLSQLFTIGGSMNRKTTVVALAFAMLAAPSLAQQSSMTFFVTSARVSLHW